MILNEGPDYHCVGSRSAGDQLPPLPLTASQRLDQTSMRPLLLSILCTLLLISRGYSQKNGEEIFTPPGSEVLLPITYPLILNHSDVQSCDRFLWRFKGLRTAIAEGRACNLIRAPGMNFPNIKVSENGSLIISNVTAKNDGNYRLTLFNSKGQVIPSSSRVYWIYVVEPVSVPVLEFSCLHDGSAVISCLLDNGSHLSIVLTVSADSTMYNSSSSERNVSLTVPPTASGNASCHAQNVISEESTNQVYNACPEISWSGRGLTTFVTRAGSEVLLPISYPLILDPPDGQSCEQFLWTFQGPGEVIAESRRCQLNESSSMLSSHVKISDNGSLIISGVAVENAGNYTVTVSDPAGGHIVFSESFRLQVAVPVSVPVLEFSCLPDGSAEISCQLDNGSDPSIFLTISGDSVEYNRSSIGSERRVSVSVPPAATVNAICHARNAISEESTNQMYGECPVPVSVPVLEFSCLPDGSAEVSCRLDNGSDPSILLTVSGASGEYNSSSIGSEWRVSVTVPPPAIGSASCHARNAISEESTNQMYDACPGSMTLNRSFLPFLLIPTLIGAAILIGVMVGMWRWRKVSQTRKKEKNLLEMGLRPEAREE